MNKKFQKISLFITIIFVFNLFFVLPVLAQEWLPGGKALIPVGCTDDDASTPCGINEFVQLLINFFQLMLGILGSLSLVFFIYGGFIWVLSRGNQQMIQKGKDIIIGSIVGLSLALGSWVIVNFTIALVTGTPFTDVKIFYNQQWWVIK